MTICLLMVTALSDLVNHVPNSPKWPKNAFRSIFGASLTCATRYFPGFALKFWSKIDIFHRYLYSYFLKIFSKSFKNRILWSNFIRKPLNYVIWLFSYEIWPKNSIFGGFWKNFEKNHCIFIFIFYLKNNKNIKLKKL